MIQPNKYHILFLTRWYPNRHDVQLGIFIRKHALAVARYCKVSLLYVQGESTLEKDFEVEINSFENFNEVKIYYRKSSFSVINFLRYVKFHFKGFKIIRQNYSLPDIIHLHVMYGLGPVARLLSSRYKLPYMVSEHWHGFTDDQFRNKNFIFKWLLKNVANNAKAITCVSEFLKNKMIECSINPNIAVIPNIVETSFSADKMSGGIIRFLTVADLVDRIKNISSVIEVFSELLRDFPDLKMEYHIIGGGTDEVNLKNQVSQNDQLKDKVIFHGRQSNEYVLKFISQIDFGIINSNTETFSVFAAELLMAGKPLICTRCGGVEDFVNQTNALIIEPKSKLQLISAIKKLLNNQIDFNFEKIRTDAKNRFSAETVGMQFFDLYSKLLQ